MISRHGPFAIDRFRIMFDRMVKSARFNRDAFLALKEDSSATGQALIVLALTGASFGVGFAASIGFSALGILLGAVLGAVVSIALGIIWVSLTFLIGRRFFWRKIGLLVTRKARILLKLSRTDIPHYVDPSVSSPRRCTCDRHILDSDFNGDRSEDRSWIGHSAQPCDIHYRHIHRSLQLWIDSLLQRERLDIRYLQPEAAITVQQSDSWLQ